ncbi:MAG: hypothetical protein COA51_11310 [Idiomarina sp.]|nr:MAG: hypothetical protein COA51_11310 [Idiomarina sp.]
MRLIRLPQVIDMTGLGRSSVYKLMLEGKFPKVVSLCYQRSKIDPLRVRPKTWTTLEVV